MPQSMQEFASLIKSKYPAYGNVADDELVRLVVTKFPSYKSQVSLDPRSEIAFRETHPPEARFGDPNPQDTTAGEIAGATAKGIARGFGIPTSGEELKRASVDVIGNATAPIAYNAYRGTEQGVADAAEGYAPIIGRPVAAIAAPSRAVLQGRPPTEDENLAAVESGSAMATAGATAAFGGKVAGRLTKAAPALEASAARGYGEALGGGPLAETIGSQLAGRRTIMRDPKAQLADAIVAEDRVPQFKNQNAAARQADDLRAKYPEAEVIAEGDDFVVRHRTPEGALPDATSPQKLVEPLEYGKRVAGAAAAGGSIGALAGPTGAFMGAKIGGLIATGAEAIGVAKRVMTNPLWRTTSAVIKSDLAKALRSKDFVRVADISAKLIGGMGLDDDFGHDAAVFDAVSTAFREADGKPDVARQILSGKKIVYENADGSEVAVPFAVGRSFLNQIDWSAPNHALGMAQGDAQGWQDQAGGAGSVPLNSSLDARAVTYPEEYR